MAVGDARRRWLAIFPPLAIGLLMIGGGSTPAGLDHPILGTSTALAELPIAAAHPGQAAASNAFKSGDMFDAVSKGKSAKDKAVEIMTALNMTVPQAATR